MLDCVFHKTNRSNCENEATVVNRAFSFFNIRSDSIFGESSIFAVLHTQSGLSCAVLYGSWLLEYIKCQCTFSWIICA